jgi:hypothetical protein
MRAFNNDDLIHLLADAESPYRMSALEFLSEGFAPNKEILPRVFAGWDHWGVAQAFPDFPILSHLPIAAQHVSECCQRATQMALGRKLTDPVARCAGKLLEQVVGIAAGDLGPHLEAIINTVSTSKIFFRVDTRGLQQRLDLQNLDADILAARLDAAIEILTRQPDNTAAFHDGLHALEVLRLRHPDYLDMSTAIAKSPANDDGPQAISFKLSLRSLIQIEQAGTEANLARHLGDHRESIYVGAVEALVRIGSPLAAAHMLSQFGSAQPPAQRWVARGLQRIRAAGLAEEISSLRAKVSDPALWLMLLVAEIRQFEASSLPRITTDVQQVKAFTGALLDALNVYVRIHASAVGSRVLQQAFMDYVQGANHELRLPLQSKLP